MAEWERGRVKVEAGIGKEKWDMGRGKEIWEEEEKTGKGRGV
jgi:hypothetical protein